MKAGRKAKGEPGDDEDDPDAFCAFGPHAGFGLVRWAGPRRAEPPRERAGLAPGEVAEGTDEFVRTPAPSSRGLDAPSANGFDAH